MMNRYWTRLRTVALFLTLAFSLSALAADASSLKPPPGAKVAIVVFEDMECPDCARAYPVVWDAANTHKVPVVLHDFPLAMHPWSFDAAVFARYFDTKSQKLGDDFRGYIFQNQPKINKQNLRQYVDKFGSDNNTPLPFAFDPDGKLKEKVTTDRDLGSKIGLQHTPTIFVVSNTEGVEVDDRSQLGAIIDNMLKKAGPATGDKKAAPKKAPAKKAAKK